MNKKEYCNSEIYRKNPEYRQIQKLLKDWKTENNITNRCVVHHRDDTEECRKYNEEHYELYGFNLDGTFEYGKYVIFMTNAEHARYHNKGENHPMHGKHHSEEVKTKMSTAHQGKHHSEEARAKISIAHQGGHLSSETKAKLSTVGKAIGTLWHSYKNNNGKLSYNEFRAALKNGEITFEMHPISVFVK